MRNRRGFMGAPISSMIYPFYGQKDKIICNYFGNSGRWPGVGGAPAASAALSGLAPSFLFVFLVTLFHTLAIFGEFVLGGLISVTFFLGQKVSQLLIFLLTTLWTRLLSLLLRGTGLLRLI